MNRLHQGYVCCALVMSGLALPAGALAQQNARLMERLPATTSAASGSLIASPAVAYPVGQTAAGAQAQAEVQAAQPQIQAQPQAHTEPQATTAKAGVSVWWDVTPVGEQTRSLMAAQAAGAQAPPEALPTVGAMASRAWDRYLESFAHPIPEWFQQHVEAVE